MADRHAVASGEEEKQHEENMIRDIQVSNGGSEAAYEEQPDNLRTTVRSEQEAPITSSSSSSHVSLENLASGKKQDHLEPMSVQNSGHVDDDIQSSVLDPSYEMDGRESRYIKEVLD